MTATALNPPVEQEPLMTSTQLPVTSQTREFGSPADGPLRLGAATGLLGLVVYAVADSMHGGHDPAHLQVTLPAYAANDSWLAVHLAQLAGIAMLTILIVTLARSLVPERPDASMARLGIGAAQITFAVYAVNQAVDGVAIKFLADSYVAAPPADKADVLLVAEAVRHIEIGLTSFFQVGLGMTLAMVGLAVRSSARYPSWLGWTAVVDGLGWVVVGILVAIRGFDVAISVPSVIVSNLLALWILGVVLLMWRAAGRQGEPGER
jgi:hypothetical protein